MNKNTIILIGFMGSGKTTVARSLAEKTNLQWIDTDLLITRSAGKSISELFETSEDYFRSWERDICRSLRNKSNCIISTGGGIIHSEETCNILKEIGEVVYLEASPQTLFERVKDSTHRPLLQTEDKFTALSTLLKKRHPLYTKLATYTLKTDQLTIDVISDTLIEHYDLQNINN